MAEKRLIDAIKLTITLSARITPFVICGADPSVVYNEVLKVIAEAETIDVVCGGAKDGI